jgi:hypothetical protein
VAPQQWRAHGPQLRSRRHKRVRAGRRARSPRGRSNEHYQWNRVSPLNSGLVHCGSFRGISRVAASAATTSVAEVARPRASRCSGAGSAAGFPWFGTSRRSGRRGPAGSRLFLVPKSRGAAVEGRGPPTPGSRRTGQMPVRVLVTLSGVREPVRRGRPHWLRTPGRRSRGWRH